MRITTKDLAEKCGVSRTTVTRALHGTGRINPDTRERILETARQLGYEPDLAARSLVSGRSMMIGVIVVELQNQYYPQIVNAIAGRVLEDDYILNITIHQDDKEMEKKLISILTGHRVDGLIISPANKGEAFRKMMEKVQVPYCVLGLEDYDDCAAVGVDEEASGRDAAEYILRKGYQRIAFVVPPMYDAEGIPNMGHYARMKGISAVMKANGYEYTVFKDRESAVYKKEALQFIESSGAQKPVLLCSGAIFAMDIMSFLRQHGYTAPKDYGLMTFDEIREYENLVPRLTCLDNHVDKIGYAAGDMMVKMLRGEKTERRIVIPHSIVEGQTL